MVAKVTSAQTRDAERRRLIDGTLAYAITHGLATLSLRPLAASLGTSDRMLLYYFTSRDNIISAVLDRLTDNLRQTLAQTVPDHPLSPRALLDHVWTVVSAPDLRPSLALYLEVDVFAARGIDPFTAAADAATATWLDWLDHQLDTPTDARSTVAAGLMTIIDGLLLQTAAHPSVPVDHVYTWLTDRLNEASE